MLLVSSAIQCPINVHPKHGYYRGSGSNYKDNVTFQCNHGFRMPLLNRKFQLEEKTNATITCGSDGLFDGIGTLVDCESEDRFDEQR